MRLTRLKESFSRWNPRNLAYKAEVNKLVREAVAHMQDHGDGRLLTQLILAIPSPQFRNAALRLLKEQASIELDAKNNLKFSQGAKRKQIDVAKIDIFRAEPKRKTQIIRNAKPKNRFWIPEDAFSDMSHYWFIGDAKFRLAFCEFITLSVTKATKSGSMGSLNKAIASIPDSHFQAKLVEFLAAEFELDATGSIRAQRKSGESAWTSEDFQKRLSRLLSTYDANRVLTGNEGFCSRDFANIVADIIVENRHAFSHDDLQTISEVLTMAAGRVDK